MLNDGFLFLLDSFLTHKNDFFSVILQKKFFVMSENFIISSSLDKKSIYESLLLQIPALIADEPDIVANLANLSAVFHQTFKWWWVGFYLVKEDFLVLGPFQGPVACTRIAFGKGVCGTAWKEKRSLLVPDVNDFSGHIACSSISVSEIVIPLYNSSSEVVGVLDIDSEKFGLLDEADIYYLEQISTIIGKALFA